MNINNIRAFLRELPIFAIYQDDELTLLLEASILISVNAGQVVFEQGDHGDSFYVVYSGRIRILQRNEQGKEVNLGVRARGDHFGETALITDRPRNATARASEDSVLIKIENAAFNKYLFTKPELREYFDKFIRHTAINQFLKTCTPLSAIPPSDLQELVQNINAEYVREGDVVFRQGAEPDKFYLIETGKLKVVSWDDNEPTIINFLREGDFFGEKALLEDTKRTADVVALTDCHLFSITKEVFASITLKSPRVKRVIEDRIESYLAPKPSSSYNELIKQELAALKRIKVQETVSRDEISLTDEKKRGFRRLSSFYHRHISFPFIEQEDQLSCGTTCIMMIARYYSKNFSSSRLRELAHVDLSGSSLANLAHASEQLGFSTRAMKLDYETLMSIQLPCIVHWQGYHFIVVHRISEKLVWVADPALGLRKYDRSYFNERWNGITLVLEPTIQFERQKEDSSAYKNFIQFVTPYKSLLLEIFAASLLLNLFGLATPIFTQNILDKVLTHHNTSMLNIMFIGMILLMIFRVLSMLIRQYLIVHTTMKVDLRMLVVFYKHLLSLPLSYFKVRKIGDFITRFGENITIRNFLTDTALTIILDTVLIVVYFSLMSYYNSQLTFLVLLFIPLFVMLTLGFTPILKRLNVDAFAARAEADSQVIESINGIDTIKAMNIEYQSRWKWEDKFIRSLNVDFKLCNTGMYFHSTGDFVGSLTSTFILWYGAHQVINGIMSVGELMAFVALLGSVITPISRIITAWDNIQQTLVSMNRLNDVFTATPEFRESVEEPAGVVLKEPRGEILFENVYFRYGSEDDPYILSNLNLKIMPGQTVAVVGRSGSGKTTLARLLSRLYDCTQGRILVDGFDIRNVNLSNLRRLVGFVLQDSFVFNDTIRGNISFGDPEGTMEKVVEAAQLANAHEFISNLALGYETRIGESGLQLSGGQKQRIAIARVVYWRPKVIIFDEATSSLDSESEQAIQKNMKAILMDKTAIVIAHRLSTVRNADNIVVLDDGEIVEQGTHTELMSQKGLYHYLTHQQLNI
jgi:ATP-binding cassette subfamily B protein